MALCQFAGELWHRRQAVKFRASSVAQQAATCVSGFAASWVSIGSSAYSFGRGVLSAVDAAATRLSPEMSEGH